MWIKIKIALYIIFGVVTTGSVTLNVIYFQTVYETKQQAEIVDSNLNNVLEELEATKQQLKEETEKNMEEISDKFDKNDEFKEVTKDTIITESEIVITVPNNHYYATLPQELEEANEMNKFLADQVNYIADKYNNDISERDKIINDLTIDLEAAKETIKDQLHDNEMGKTQEALKNNLFKWGIEAFVSGDFDFYSLPDVVIYPTFGVGVNCMFVNKFYVRGNVGIEIQKHPSVTKYVPQLGVGVGFYF